MKYKFMLAASALAIFLTSCSKDDDVTPSANLKVPYTGLTTTTNYFETFKDASGKTTVNFDGQATRIAMLKELDGYIKTGTTTQLVAMNMKNMFKNENTPFASGALNLATDKTIISKTAQSFAVTEADAERQRFMGYFDALTAVSAHNTATASVGVAGIILNGTSKYLVNEKGFEYAQFVQKGLMGAMMMDQICNIYLGTEKMAADNSQIVDGKNYTALEHSWDEAYGYLTANEVFPKKDPADATKWLESFLGGYIRQVGYNEGVPQNIFLAFLTGRAAIVNKDLAKRDEQIAFIRTNMEKSLATVAISYLNKTKTAANDGAKFHALSEGIGFIYALRFANNAKVNRAKSEELLTILLGKPNGFWDLTNADLDNVREQLSTLTGVSKDALVDH